RLWTDSLENLLVVLAGNPEKPLEARTAALYAISQRGIDTNRVHVSLGTPRNAVTAILPALAALSDAPQLRPFVVRSLGDLGEELPAAGKPSKISKLVQRSLVSDDPRTLVEAMIAAARLEM